MEPEETEVSPPDASLANVSAIPGHNKHSQDVLKKFNWAIKKVANEHGTNNTSSLTEEELIQLIRAWEPQRDIVCLYVRWSRQLKRNFNLDSIATLLCLSRQCGYTPLAFLRKVKTLTISKSKKGAYGLTFTFDTPDRQEIPHERLNKEFIGLSVTLALLQEQVTDMPSILGKTKMRQSGPRNTLPIGIHVEGEDKQQASIMTHPNSEFHTQSSLLNRIWLSIKHRWIALYIVEHLFREDNQPSWSFQEALIFSFQMMAPCGPVRFEFLAPLVGYCLKFPSQESIKTKRTRLREIRSDPSTFLSFGKTCLSQFSSEAQTRMMQACFHDLGAEITATKHPISYNRDCPLARRWNMLRSYVFHFWLESTSNKSRKDFITDELTPSNGRKSKRKRNNDNHTNPTANRKSPPSNPIVAPARQFEKPVQSTRRLVLTNGLHSITASRHHPNPTAASTINNLPSENRNLVDVAPKQKDHDLMATFDNNKTTRLRLITAEEMECLVQSYLIIHRHDGVDVVSELSPLEVYSADKLHDLSHCRLSGPMPFFPKSSVGPVYLHVRPDADQFIDTHSKSFHVVRERNDNFLEHSSLLPTMNDILVLCKAIVRHGKVDSKRALGQYRLNIGNGGQNWVNGAPCQLHGLNFEKELDNDGEFDTTNVLQSIGRLVEFTWLVACSLQGDAKDTVIAPDRLRKKLYAHGLNRYLNIDDEEVGFEDLTLVVSSLLPVTHEVSEHKDTMNDTLAGYTRTACFNMVMIDDNKDQPSIVHFQVICNFRKVIGHHVVPFHGYLSNVAKHCRTYMDNWHRSMQMLYAGKSTTIPSAYDRSSIFLDDCLLFTTVAISDATKHKQSILSQYILSEICISRTLSLSMFIDPLFKMQPFLKFDQTIELALACSFLSNPFWFEWTMSTLIDRLNDPNDPFQLGLHPFYDWSRATIEIFGTWQGGPYNRWSPCGGSKESVLETFGADPSATTDARKIGEGKLSRVVSILCNHVEWINSLSECGETPVVDMPLASMKERCNRTINEIAQVAACQFSHFRLGILTTILSGCGLLRAGKHLRQCMYPVKGSASYKHLSHPIADCMSREKASALSDNMRNETITNDGDGCVHEQHHDLFMQYLSAELGFRTYLRDEMECILCESHPMRSLNCRDWFRKGMSLYDCNENGEFLRRPYGKSTKWEKLCPPREYEFAYLGTASIQYIPIDDQLSYYAANFGEDLRAMNCKRVKFKGRSTRTSSHQRLYTSTYQSKDTFRHPGMQMADFYLGSYLKKNKQEALQSVFVLGDAEHAVELKNCNDLGKFRYGKILHEYLLSLVLPNNDQALPVMAAGCYHMDSDSTNDVTTFFPGHLDKPFVHTVWFVPLGSTAFFTLLAVRTQTSLLQDPDSLLCFNEWMDNLSASERHCVREFLCDFDAQAKKHMRQESVNRFVYLNKVGSVLSFPANQCYHATITPKKPSGYPRDLFIFHPLDGISCTAMGSHG